MIPAVSRGSQVKSVGNALAMQSRASVNTGTHNNRVIVLQQQHQGASDNHPTFPVKASPMSRGSAGEVANARNPSNHSSRNAKLSAATNHGMNMTQ